MLTLAPSSLRRTWYEIGAMLLVAAVALACVAAVNQRIAHKLDSGAAHVQQTVFAEDKLPIPEEPAPPAMVMISSPVDGIFQAGNIAGGPALVAIGATVKPETKVGAVQPMNATAMPLLAGVTGTVKEILAKDQEMVMAGQALIKIEPTQVPEAPQQ